MPGEGQGQIWGVLELTLHLVTAAAPCVLTMITLLWSLTLTTITTSHPGLCLGVWAVFQGPLLIGFWFQGLRRCWATYRGTPPLRTSGPELGRLPQPAPSRRGTGPARGVLAALAAMAPSPVLAGSGQPGAPLLIREVRRLGERNMEAIRAEQSGKSLRDTRAAARSPAQDALMKQLRPGSSGFDLNGVISAKTARVIDAHNSGSLIVLNLFGVRMCI